MRTRYCWGLFVFFVLFSGSSIFAEDWPEFRGAGRLGVWQETGVLERFPDSGLKPRWRVPIRAGYSGPAVADGRVFVTDFEMTNGMRGTERALALDEVSGEELWVQEWPADYAGIQWAVSYTHLTLPTIYSV